MKQPSSRASCVGYKKGFWQVLLGLSSFFWDLLLCIQPPGTTGSFPTLFYHSAKGSCLHLLGFWVSSPGELWETVWSYGKYKCCFSSVYHWSYWNPALFLKRMFPLVRSSTFTKWHGSTQFVQRATCSKSPKSSVIQTHLQKGSHRKTDFILLIFCMIPPEPGWIIAKVFGKSEHSSDSGGQVWYSSLYQI